MCQPEDHWEQHNHTEEKNHPRSVFALAEAAEQAEGVSGRSEREKRRSGPAQEQRYRVCEERAGPAEVPCYITVAVEPRIPFGGEGSAEKDREQQQDDSADLARKRRLRRPIVRVPARAS